MLALSPKGRIFWPIFVIWLVLDLVTKHFALQNLQPGVPHEVLGEYLRFTLAFNRGAAMGMSLGDYSRPVFTIIPLVLLCGLGWLYHKTRNDQRLQAAILHSSLREPWEAWWSACGTKRHRLTDAGSGRCVLDLQRRGHGDKCGAIALHSPRQETERARANARAYSVRPYAFRLYLLSAFNARLSLRAPSVLAGSPVIPHTCDTAPGGDGSGHGIGHRAHRPRPATAAPGRSMKSWSPPELAAPPDLPLKRGRTHIEGQLGAFRPAIRFRTHPPQH
jgi:hypothetical protein